MPGGLRVRGHDRRRPLGAVNRDAAGRSLLDFLDLSKLTILPNSASCFSTEGAIRHARLARGLLGNLGNPGADWVNLECLADKPPTAARECFPTAGPISPSRAVRRIDSSVPPRRSD
jgi:hypothetical protein